MADRASLLDLARAHHSPADAVTWLGIGLLRLVALLPFPAIHALGSGIGTLGYRLHESRRRVTLRNLERCFPEMSAAERETTARRHFQALAIATLGSTVNWWASGKRLDRLVTYRGRRHFDEAVRAGRNVIVLAPHFVALEIAGIHLSRERPMTSMYKQSGNTLFDRFVKRGRSRFGGVLFEHREPMREMVRSIRAGKPFYYLPDQEPARRHGIFVPFFGIETLTLPALGRIARLGKAVVIPCHTRLLPRGRGYEVILEPPLAGFPTGDEQADTTRMNAVIERAVRAMPEQYFWVHKRFKTRPPGEAPFYD